MDLGTKLFIAFVAISIVLAGITIYMNRIIIGVILLVLPIIVFIAIFIYAGINDRIDIDEVIMCVRGN